MHHKMGLNGGRVEVGGERVGRSDGAGLGGRGSEVVGWVGGVRTLRTYKVITNTHATNNVK